MPKQLGLVPLLKQFGFDTSLRTKLIRHHDQKFGIRELIFEGWFDLYQSLQARSVFHNCDQIVSFSSESGSRARFIGVYRVLGHQPVPAKVIPKECPYKEISSTSTLQYRLERDPRFHDLEHRVVIDWGKGAIKWDQHLTDKIVIEVLPPGRSLPEFSDYLDFTLTYQELVRLYRHPTAHRDWYSSLSAVAGVYLILSESSGRQYVGSACGTTGIWGRWKQYAVNGHGGNEILKELLKNDSGHPKEFRYSVLQVLPKTTVKKEVIRWESQYKRKLGSRATGLNGN